MNLAQKHDILLVSGDSLGILAYDALWSSLKVSAEEGEESSLIKYSVHSMCPMEKAHGHLHYYVP